MLLGCLYVVAVICAAVVDVVFLAGIEAEASFSINLLHLGSFSFLYGINIWNSLLAGFLLIRTIPRHMFGRAQSTLLPAFFSVSFSLVCLTLTAIFLQYPYHKMEQWNPEILYQLFTLSSVMIIYAMLLLFIIPKTTGLMNKMYIFEREAGVGEEICMTAPRKEELVSNAEYMALKRSFGMMHGISSLLALTCVVLLTYHLYFLAGKFSIQTDIVENISTFSHDEE